MRQRKCDNCNEEMKCSNYERHGERCQKRKKFTRKKEGLCDICKNWKRAIKDHEKEM